MQPSQKALSLCLRVAVDIYVQGQIIFPRICWKWPNWLIDCLGLKVCKLLNTMLSILSVTLTVILRVGIFEHNRDLLHFISKILMNKVKVTKAYLLPSKVIVARFWLYKSEIPTFFFIFLFSRLTDDVEFRNIWIQWALWVSW